MRPLSSVVLSLSVCLTLAAQQPPVNPNVVDKIMLSTMKAWQIPGAAVAIVKNDRVVYIGAYGVRDVVSGEKVTPDTLFQIAWTSKAFTSTALAMLVDDGKLGWDDRVREHLPYFKLADYCANEQVTLRDIVTHRTGVATHDELWEGTPWSREEVIRRTGGVPLAQPFRGEFQYQNAMFIAAGEVVTHASGMPWDDFVRARIFKPLDMTRTMLTDEEWAANEHATGYRYDWKTGRVAPQTPMDTTTIGPSGGIKSTARDMANWLRFQLANGVYAGTQLVSAEALGETKQPHVPLRVENSRRDLHPESNVMAYGMGWYVQDYRGELLISHNGALNGFRTHIDLLPKRNAGFIVMTNLGRATALLSLRNALSDVLTQKPVRDWNAYYLMIDRKADEKDERERLQRRARRQSGTTPSRPIASYAGTYKSATHGTARITRVSDTLLLEWNRLRIPLAHFHYDVWLAESEADDVDAEVAFTLSPEGMVKSLTFYGATFTRLSS